MDPEPRRSESKLPNPGRETMLITAQSARIAGVLALLVMTGPVAKADTWRDRLRPFLEANCLQCHEGEDASGGFDLTSLADGLNGAETARRWILVHDRIAAGEMPPKEEPGLPKATKSTALRTLATALTQAGQSRNTVVLRRLNRTEYENTMRDLFDVHVRVRDMLPEDTPTDGFDNVGEGLAVSAEAMTAYLRAADVTLDAVFGPPKEPKRIHHVTNPLDQKGHDGSSFIDRHIGTMFRKTDDGLVIFQSGYCPTNLVNFARLRAPVGTYRAKFRVRAVQSEDPVTLRIYGGDTIVGRREKHLVGYYDILPGDWTTVEFEDRLVEASGTFQPKCYGTKDTRKDADTYPEPGIEISTITIEGPLEKWPPKSRARLLGAVDPRKGTARDGRAILARILPRAFRRNVESAEVDPYAALTESALEAGEPFEAALRLGLKAVLCSPQLLFLDEPGREVISQHAIASRLSYFLWSSVPDAELLSLADQGTLDDPKILREQVERVLNDPRARRFTKNFTGQWLRLRDIDFTTPDMKLYPEFDELLKVSMVEETERFFQEMLDHDLSVMNFIDSDFAILNERLALHYGIEGVKGQAFRKVLLPPDSVRGGVLTQASVLKVTANGTNTSPVLRGAWVLRNILGTPPSPPPANAPTVEPDIRGATTLREQLAKHRNVESCAICHAKIDPPGFALENFDVIGGWRDNYRTFGVGRRPEIRRSPITYAWISYKIGLPVDATGQTVDGRSFHDIREFKRLLSDERTTITTGLTKNLLTYALGRRIGFSDRPAVREIVAKASGENLGLRTLIHEIVESPMFRRP